MGELRKAWPRADLAKIIRQMPIRFQTVLALRHCEDLSVPEIAAVLRITPPEARMLLRVAYERLNHPLAQRKKTP